MNIVFWSNRSGQCSVSSNAVTMAMMSILKHSAKCSLIQTSMAHNSLAQSLLGDKAKIVTEYLDDIGIDSLLRKLQSGSSSIETICSSGIPLLSDNLCVYLPTEKRNDINYYSEFCAVSNNFVKTLNGIFDINFIDAGFGVNPMTKELFLKSDILVICVNQNKYALDELNTYYKFDDSKVFYLFGNYDENQRMNIRNITRTYKKINSKNSAVIPYNIEFANAMNTGTLVKFFLRGIQSNKDLASYPFISSADMAYNKLLAMMNVIAKRREAAIENDI